MVSVQCPRWKLQASFLRIVPGKELDVVHHLKKENPRKSLHYKCLGDSDIVELTPDDE